VSVDGLYPLIQVAAHTKQVFKDHV
jgi:hypothetical protein